MDWTAFSGRIWCLWWFDESFHHWNSPPELNLSVWRWFTPLIWKCWRKTQLAEANSERKTWLTARSKTSLSADRHSAGERKSFGFYSVPSHSVAKMKQNSVNSVSAVRLMNRLMKSSRLIDWLGQLQWLNWVQRGCFSRAESRGGRSRADRDQCWCDGWWFRLLICDDLLSVQIKDKSRDCNVENEAAVPLKTC